MTFQVYTAMTEMSFGYVGVGNVSLPGLFDRVDDILMSTRIKERPAGVDRKYAATRMSDGWMTIKYYLLFIDYEKKIRGNQNVRWMDDQIAPEAITMTIMVTIAMPIVMTIVMATAMAIMGDHYYLRR